jgi:phospholipase/carboxylesterase
MGLISLCHHFASPSSPLLHFLSPFPYPDCYKIRAHRVEERLLSLNAITIPAQTKQPAKGLIVLLHGWGANCQDLLGLAEFMDLGDYQLVFPDAPFVHPYNPVGKMWYDLPQDYRFVGTAQFGDRPDLTQSREQLTNFLNSLTDQLQIPFSRTILGGFSQGGAMTLDVGLQLPLAGLMVLSGYLHAPPRLQTTDTPAVFIVHGRQDMVVPVQAAHRTRDSLQALGVPVQYQEYPFMGHEIQPVVLEQLQTFVKEILD